MGTINEVTFMSDVAGWINSILEKHPDLPFTHAKIEESAKGKRTRRDLSLYDRDGKKALTGEAKLPDNPEGRSPFVESVVQDAFVKASDVGARYFFTWNVNRFVLWDPGKVKLPVLHRYFRDFPLFTFKSREEVASPTVAHKLRNEFLPQLLDELAALYRGETQFGTLPPDQRFVLMLEDFLASPVELTRFEVQRLWHHNKGFRKDLTEWAVKRQKWTIPKDEDALQDLLDRAAKQCCYVLSNKVIFYEALRRRFPLKPIRIPKHIDSVDRMYGLLSKYFEQAQRLTQDYETIFWPDYGAKVPLLAPGAIDAWKDVIAQIGLFDLRNLGYDVMGPIFQRLIDKDAKHKYGQHYTQPTIVDVINAFTIRTPDAVVLDPGCGSGTFLIRAYARKKWLDPAVEHPALLSQIYGVDWSGFAVHLSALGLAGQDLVEADNYPRVAREDFFDVQAETKFMTVPRRNDLKSSGLGSKQIEVPIPRIDAGVGNPPYIRQEEIPKSKKKHYQTVAKHDAPAFDFSGRSDIYVYFWPHLFSFLKQDGYLGFLTSSSWLDVEYGFRLQKWFLENFKVLAILESICEPWFEAARVQTAVTIVQPCREEKERLTNPVRFMQLRVPISEMLENDGTEDGRQRAAERLRDLLFATETDTRTDQYRILVRSQEELWIEGCRLASRELGDDEDEEAEENPKEPASMHDWHHKSLYVGGKWGRYLRAPDFFFELMDKYENAFVPLGELADVRFGVKSGCDGFFFPEDNTEEALRSEPEPRKFMDRYGVARSNVESREIRIVKAGDGSVWPIEAMYLEPEVHSSMQIDSVRVDKAKLKDKILLVDKPKSELSNGLVLRYLQYGERATFGKDKTVPERKTCASRGLWYNLTGGVRGEGFWPKGQKYRHMVAWNKDHLYCNCRLYDIIPNEGVPGKALIGLLNSTLVAFFKHFYGRQAGMEGTLEIMVLDANMLLVPDIRRANPTILRTLELAVDHLLRRDVDHFLEEAFLKMVPVSALEKLSEIAVTFPPELRRTDRQELDRAALELIGVPEHEISDAREHLYKETALVYRRGRILDIRTAANKRKAKRVGSVTPSDLAANVWEGLPDGVIRFYPSSFIPSGHSYDHYSLPDGKCTFVPSGVLHGPCLKFKGGEIEFRSHEQAQLAMALHESGLRDTLSIPVDAAICATAHKAWNEYLRQLRQRFEGEVAQRTPDEEKTEAAVSILLRRALGQPM
jgi:SAM-dependent methyltransferase